VVERAVARRGVAGGNDVDERGGHRDDSLSLPLAPVLRGEDG
jgi:hypothetical protein